MAQYEVTLRDYWRILRRRKGIVVFTAFLLGFFSFILATLWQPIPVYTAAAKVQLISNEQNVANMYQVYSGGDDLETQMSVITSYPLLKRVIRELRIPAETEDDTARAIIDLQDRLDIDQEGYAKILLVKIDDTDPERAAEIVNTVSQVFKEYSDEQKNQQSDDHLNFVNGQLLGAKDSLRVAEENARRYREENDIVSIDAEASMMLGQIADERRNKVQLEQVINAVGGMMREIEGGQELSQRTLQGVSREQVGDAFMLFAQQLNALRLDRDGLLVQFTENHPAVRQVQAKIDLMVENMANELRQRRLKVQDDLQSVDGQLAALQEKYSNLPARGLELDRREREVYLRQEIVEALAGEYEQARMRAADRVETAKVLQRALVPTLPNNPQSPVQRGVLGMILGLVLGIVFAVVAETLDTSIGTIEDVQEYTGAKVVGVVPFIRAESVAESMERQGYDIENERMLQRMAQLVAYFDPQSTLAETFRTLRTNIEFVTAEKGDKTLLVTSSTSGEGKSTVMANLAMTMTQLGKRTLLVDCDLRKPTVARMFGLDKEPGLAEVIVGNYHWREVIRTVTDIVTGGMGMENLMQTQGISNLHIITSGSIPPNPAELLNSSRMDDFIGEVREVYDIVLFDAPPILHVTDAAILGKKVDGALMLYKAGDIPRTSLKRAVNLLNSVGVDLLGIVLNGIRAETSSDYYDFGYNSYYSYGNEDGRESLTWMEKAQEYLFKRHRDDIASDDDDDDDGEDGGAGYDPLLTGRIRGEPEEAEEREDKWAPWARTGSAVLLVCAALGLLWQSGLLQRPLGAVPVFAYYNRPLAADALVDGVRGGEADELSAAAQEVGSGVGVATASMSLDPAVGIDADGLSDGPTRARAEPAANVDGDRVWSPMSPYTLRIGAYTPSSKWAVPNLNTLRQSGQMAFLAPPTAGDAMVRLMSGSYPSWDAAFHDGRQLREAGLVGEVAPAYLPFALELGRFARQSQTLEFLQSLGEKARFCYVQVGSDGLQRVLAGAFETAEEANEAAEVMAFGRPARVGRR